ncbi:MAG: hypothetical protein C0403_06405 [Desulfobacterium sp.]|nr:hypothetical protein [Desulfobacterium sp.]
MDPKLYIYYQELKERGLSAEQENLIREEMNFPGTHSPEPNPGELNLHRTGKPAFNPVDLYSWNDLTVLHRNPPPVYSYVTALRSLDDLLKRDKQREEDNFPRKVRVGRLVKPGKGGKNNVIIVPTTVEEKFIHDSSFGKEEEETMGGAGEGEEGDILGEQPIRPEDGQDSSGPGEGEGGAHEIESSAYDLGKILSEQFELPNIKDKGKKRSLTRYTYDMTDKNRGFGQILDKKATLRKVLETNIALGNVPDYCNIDPTRFIIAPSDKVYRILSREKDYESQAVVFFLRDYSGSMSGKPTSLIVAQHVLIYSWLVYQYSMQVESRFILHDTEAREVPDFYTYYNSKVAGGTKVSSAYKLVNEIVEKDNLARNYNIYVFHGTDGDDWDTDGKEAIPLLDKMTTYANRIGITIAERAYGSKKESEVEKYIKKSNLLTQKPKLIRMDILNENADEPRLIEGIKHLLSE